MMFLALVNGLSNAKELSTAKWKSYLLVLACLLPGDSRRKWAS